MRPIRDHNLPPDPAAYRAARPKGRVIVIAPTRAACETIELALGSTFETLLIREHGQELVAWAEARKGFGIVAGTGTGKTLSVRLFAEAILGESLRYGVVNREREATPETPFWNVIVVTTGIARRWFQDELITAADTLVVDEIHQTSVTDLLKFVKDKYLLPLTTLVEQLFVMDQKRQYLVDLPDKLQMGQTVESVAEINGLVIPSIYESETLGRSSIVDYVDEHMRSKKSHYLRAYYEKIVPVSSTSHSTTSTIKRYTQYALLYTSLQHGVLNNLAQIDDVSWLTDKMVDDCHRLLYRELGARDIPIEFEVPVFYECTDYNEYGVIQLSGRIDAFQQNRLYEIKCVDALTLEHFLQLVVYAWMDMESSTDEAGSTTYTLLNLKTGEVYRLDATNVTKINDIILILFKNKFGESKRMTNREFLDSFL